MRLFLIRHGQTAANFRGVAQGHMDEPLDEVGLSQAQRLADWWTDPLDEIWTSDLSRCRVTAELLASSTGAPMRLEPRLRERSFGELEGKSFEIVRSTIEAIRDAEGVEIEAARPPFGESNLDVWARIEPLVEELGHVKHKAIAVVTHGGTCSTLLARLLQANPPTLRSFRFGNTALTELSRLSNGLFRLERYAETPHLVEPSIPMFNDHAPTRS